MANFRPLKNYLIILIDELIETYQIKGPFLDGGCGKGDLTYHLAQKGWQGLAVDLSQESIDKAEKLLVQHRKSVRIKLQDISSVKGKFKSIFICDVLEHLRSDRKILTHIRKLSTNKTKIIISVPIRKKEWRWDDDYYGHLRRYEIDNLKTLLLKSGFEIMEIWDFTFPVFWAMRRFYTAILPKRLILGEPSHLRTINSASESAWDRGILTTLFEKIIWWKPVFYLQSKFKKNLYGCECVILAKVKNDEGKSD